MNLFQAANQTAIRRAVEVEPVLTDVAPAGEAIPGMSRNLILHGGPPIQWNEMVDPMRGAVLGVLVFEGLAGSTAEAAELVERGDVRFAPCHDYGAVGPMAGLISYSMPVFVLENPAHGSQTFASINEGLGRTLRFGAFDDNVLTRLCWIRDRLSPALSQALKTHGGIPMASLMQEALTRGDELHNRNKAATALFFKRISLALLDSPVSRSDVRSALEFIDGNDHFFLNLSIAACKAVADAMHGIDCCTIVTAMTSNGVSFGIRVSGLGNHWYLAPAPYVEGRYFEGFSSADAAPVLGDSLIAETVGLGAFALVAAPAIVSFVGGDTKLAISLTHEMRRIVVTSHPKWRVPYLDYEGTPFGIDLVKVCELGIPPVADVGIACRRAGVGQVGAGLVTTPLDCFRDAYRDLMASGRGRRQPSSDVSLNPAVLST